MKEGAPQVEWFNKCILEMHQLNIITFNSNETHLLSYYKAYWQYTAHLIKIRFVDLTLWN